MTEFIQKNQNLGVIIVDKGGSLKVHTIKDYDEAELYKKCGFKKGDGFDKQTVWSVKYNGFKHFISVYAKTDGKANSENKYDFPPPIDTKLFFGSCAVVAAKQTEKGEKELISLTLPLWEKIYEKLFGGFESLVTSAGEDEDEEDELADIPADKKTKKGGYLKDGFVVDSDSAEEDNDSGESGDEDDEDEDDSNEDEDTDEVEELIDIGSELSEEEYEYEDDDDSTESTEKK